MARASPPTRRVAAVLAAIVSEPGHLMTLAEISKRTQVSKATALGILNELAAAGWLDRDPVTKAFRPGPSMLAAGAAAQESFASIGLAREPLNRLAQTTGLPCTLSAVVGGHVTVLARADADRRGTPAFRVGQRYPFAPPSGVMFVAWEDEATVEEWLLREPLSPLRPDPAGLRAVVAVCRANGYLVVGLGERSAGLYALLAELDDDQLLGRLGDLLNQTMPAEVQPYLVDPVRPADSYDVSLACAPAFNRNGRMEFLVSVLLMRPAVRGTDLAGHIAQLTDTATGLTLQLGGRNPWM